MWSYPSGSAGSRWPALELQRTPVWTTSRSGEYLLAPTWLGVAHADEETFLMSPVPIAPNTTNACVCWCRVCRFTAVAETLLRVREQLQKLQDQSSKDDGVPGPVAQMTEFTHSLFTKLLAKWDMRSGLFRFMCFTQTDYRHVLSCFAVLWWLRNNLSCPVYRSDLSYLRPLCASLWKWGKAAGSQGSSQHRIEEEKCLGLITNSNQLDFYLHLVFVSSFLRFLANLPECVLQVKLVFDK